MMIPRIKSTTYWRATKIILDIDEVIYLLPEEDVIMEIEDLVEFDKFIFSLSGKKKNYSIVDLRIHYLRISPNAIRFVTTNPKIIKHIGANAHVVGSLANRLTSNFILKIFPPPFPYKTFNNLQDARLWLLKEKSRK